MQIPDAALYVIIFGSLGIAVAAQVIGYREAMKDDKTRKEVKE